MTRLRCGDETRVVAVHTERGGLRVVVDDATFTPRVAEVGPGTFVADDGDHRRRFHCVRRDGTIHLWWKGVAYQLREEEEGPSRAASPRHLEARLEAPMPGRVIAVRVQPGQAVTKGEELLVVESMKMENALRAPRDGTVSAVLATVGEMVGPGRVLVELS